MSNLDYVKLSELVLEKPRNGLYKGKEFQGEGHRWIKMSEVYGNDFFLDQETELLKVNDSEIAKFNCKSGDLLFGRTSLTLEGIGDCLIIGDIEDTPIFESNLFRIRFDLEKAYPLFYFYFFKSKAGKLLIQTIAKQTAATSITATDLLALPVPYIPVEDQKQIADKIYCFDKKIELNRQTNQTLEQIAQAIFKSWFVDFDPTRAKIAAREEWAKSTTAMDSPEGHNAEAIFVERAAMCAISGKSFDERDHLTSDQLEQLKTTAALFPDALVESELGEIPEGWNTCQLEQLCELNANSWTKKTAPIEIEYVDLANTKNGVIQETSFYSWDEAPSRARRILNGGDTIVGTVRPGNRSFAYIGNTDRTLTASTGFAVLSPKDQRFKEYVYLAATSDDNIDRLTRLADGGAYPAVRPDVVAQLICVQPTYVVFEQFSKITSNLFNKQQSNFHEMGVLEETRDTLLPKLLSGELTPQANPPKSDSLETPAATGAPE